MSCLGIDYGERRIGLAVGERALGVATPIAAAVEPTPKERMAHIAAEIERRRVTELVVGYPLNMDGTAGFKAREVDAFVDKLKGRFGLPVHLVDERLSSRAAEADMRQFGLRKRDPLAQRRSGELDSRAAALILQDFFDTQCPPLLPDEEEPE